MQLKTLVFDLDGTLLNTLKDIGDAMNRVLKRHDLPTYPESSYRFFVGEGSGKLIEKALPKSHLHLKDAFLQEYLTEYGSSWDGSTHPYDGIEAMLTSLSTQFELCILSNKPDAFTRQCVAHFLGGFKFGAIRGQVEGIPRKPDPKGLYEICATLDCPISDCAIIGDTRFDMECGNNAGIPAIGVTWGFRPRKELEDYGASMIIDHPSHIHDALKELTSTA